MACALSLLVASPAAAFAQTPPPDSAADTARAVPAPAEAGQPAAEAQEAEPPPDSWRFTLDFAMSAASGNENLTVLTSALKIVHLVTDDYELEFGSDIRYGRSEGEEVARNLRAQLKFDFQPESEFSPFVFASGERDPFRKLDLRANAGAGARYRLWRASEGQELSLSLAALYSYENHRLTGAPADAGIAPFAQEARTSWRLKLLKLTGDGVQVENATFYQPRWNHYADYRLESASAVRMLVTDWIALSFGYAYQRDTTPLPDVRRDDHLMRAGVTLQW